MQNTDDAGVKDTRRQATLRETVLKNNPDMREFCKKHPVQFDLYLRIGSFLTLFSRELWRLRLIKYRLKIENWWLRRKLARMKLGLSPDVASPSALEEKTTQ